jgi:hypothetical protein
MRATEGDGMAGWCAVTIDPASFGGELLIAESEAQQITSRIREWVKAFPAEDVKLAYQGRIWLAMGYDSWAEWCGCGNV